MFYFSVFPLREIPLSSVTTTHIANREVGREREREKETFLVTTRYLLYRTGEEGTISNFSGGLYHFLDFYVSSLSSLMTTPDDFHVEVEVERYMLRE